MSMSMFELVDRLEDLWFAERCDWSVNIGEGTVEVTLEWTQEYGNQHEADWTTHYWVFGGSTVEEALTGAITWCEALLPFERCGACDGEGEYNWNDARVQCEACKGSGLERDVVQQSS